MTEERELDVLCEMRDLLRMMAEPAIAERDKKLRQSLRDSVSGSKAIKAVQIMDGTKTQADIVKKSGIHQGQLSVLVKRLSSMSLLAGDIRQPKIAIPVPANFFEER